jgi:hypothetical protein
MTLNMSMSFDRMNRRRYGLPVDFWQGQAVDFIRIRSCIEQLIFMQRSDGWQCSRWVDCTLNRDSATSSSVLCVALSDIVDVILGASLMVVVARLLGEEH